MTARVSIQTEDFDLAAEVAALRQGDGRVGAVCSFVGTVRDRNDGQSVSTMELEHYPGMTEKSIEAMIDAAHRRFDILMRPPHSVLATASGKAALSARAAVRRRSTSSSAPGCDPRRGDSALKADRVSCA
jgi:molybdopterin synthase catalytic subunit